MRARRTTLAAVSAALGLAAALGASACGEDERGGVEVQGAGTDTTGGQTTTTPAGTDTTGGQTTTTPAGTATAPAATETTPAATGTSTETTP